MGHVISCFPDYKSSLESAIGICDGGADFLEVQFPFSDPIADGPVIEDACCEAIKNGFTVKRGFKFVEELGSKTSTIILIMTYANIIFRYGIKKFVKDAREAGVAGLIIPDIPPDIDENLNVICKENDIANILIATPGTSGERIRQLSEKGGGFLYTVIRRGITGKETDITKRTENWLKFVKKNSLLPTAVGFGIRTSKQIKQIIGFCSVVVVGSCFVSLIKDTYLKNGNLRKKMCDFTKKLLAFNYNVH